MRDGFDCQNPGLTSYLRTQAGQDARRSLSTVFCATEGDAPAVVGYFTLSPSSLALSELPPTAAAKLPLYPDVPAYLIGRLAVDRHSQGKGIGAALLADALARCANNRIAAWAVVVDAIDDDAAAFYEAFGFVGTARSNRLFLPTEMIARQLRT